MKIPLVTKLSASTIINTASYLKQEGWLTRSKNNLVYLDIDDAYIHKLFPLLQDHQIKMPNYFGKELAGAHITVISPEENKKINKNYLGQKHDFIIKDFVTAQLGHG